MSSIWDSKEWAFVKIILRHGFRVAFLGTIFRGATWWMGVLYKDDLDMLTLVHTAEWWVTAFLLAYLFGVTMYELVGVDFGDKSENGTALVAY